MKKIIRLFIKIFTDPRPLRLRIISNFLKYFNVGTTNLRLIYNAEDRPYYSFCLYTSAKLAISLGINKISVIEFGVAGGNGLLILEKIAKNLKKELNIEIDIYGFDSGTGLPLTDNYKDQLYFWKGGDFQMDEKKLQSKLKLSKLVIGDVSKTASTFFNDYKPAPLGAILFDLDFYSSTIDSFKIFDNINSYNSLPRIYSYFDDISSVDLLPANQFTGVLCAINEYNQINQKKKISKMEHLSRFMRVPMPWNELIYVFHNFEHNEYNTYINREYSTSLPLDK